MISYLQSTVLLALLSIGQVVSANHVREAVSSHSSMV